LGEGCPPEGGARRVVAVTVVDVVDDVLVVVELDVVDDVVEVEVAPRLVVDVEL
jgi:hypothetical protein